MSAVGNDDEDRLMIDLFRGYNALVQPVANKSHLPMIVQIAMQLVLLVNVVSSPEFLHVFVFLKFAHILNFYMKKLNSIFNLQIQDEKQQVMHTNVWLALVSFLQKIRTSICIISRNGMTTNSNGTPQITEE